MAKIIRGPQDASIKALKKALDTYENRFPGASASLYRQNPGAVRIRIVDDRFAGWNRARRHDEVWEVLTDLVGEDAMSEVSTLLLFPKSELRSSLANMEFERPLPARR
jgi:stress-induced morphogen